MTNAIVPETDEVISVSPDLFRKRALLAAFEVVKILNRDEMRLYDNGKYKIYLNLSEYNTMFSRAIGFFERKKFLLCERLLGIGNIFFDLGGNKGDFAMLAASVVGPAGRVFCFEPLPTNTSWISKSAAANNFVNLSVVEACVAAAPGEIELYVGQKSGWNSIFARSYETPIIRCKAITLDDFAAEHSIDHINLVKIDIEGAELQALQGATRVMSDLRPIMLVDVHRNVIKNEGVADLFKLALENNYVIFNDVDMSEATDARKVRNSTVFTPREKIPIVLGAHKEVLESESARRARGRAARELLQLGEADRK